MVGNQAKDDTTSTELEDVNRCGSSWRTMIRSRGG